MKANLNIGIFWFRYDQRLSDNLALVRLCAEADRLIPVFVIDPRWFEPQRQNCRQMGQHRWRFICESLIELQSQLKALDSDLLILEGAPEVEIAKLVQKYQARILGVSRCPGVYEKKQLEAIQHACPQLEIISEESSTLFRQEQLPFSLENLPGHFTPFRKKVEKLDIDPAAKAPDWLPALPKSVASAESLSSVLHQYQKKHPDILQHDAQPSTIDIPFNGGVQAGKARLESYTFGSQRLLNYKQTRNGLLEFEDSSKFSPWLANGNLSPKEIYWKIKQFEEKVEANESTYWLYFELLWREYFQWYLHKHKSKSFKFSGIKDKSPLTSFWPERFEKWRTGNTPWPIVNACMRQLNATGYMSNRGRQLVASCLVHELNLDWRYGAAWFEEQLIDYDVAANWGNWQYLAGVGADPRGHRKFDLEKQTQQYDPEREFINHWITSEESVILAKAPLDSTDLVDWPIG